jgi:hypothetical protein
MARLRHKWIIGPFAVMLIAFTPSAARAQDQSGQESEQNQNQQSQGEQGTDQSAAPIPAYHSPLAGAADNGDSGAETEQIEPDTQALSGVETLTLGGLKTSHSYWQPHIDIFESADSNAQETPGGSSWGAWTSLMGGVDVHHVSDNTNLAFTYLGGALFSSGTGAGTFQQLGFTDRFTLRRWTLSFADQFSYLPAAAFGFGGLGGVGLPGGTLGGIGSTLGGIGSAFLPGQTLLFGEGSSVMNAFTPEADFSLTPRTSLTFAGGYSLLNFSDSNLLNSWTATARVGYNYLLTRKDTVAVLYTYNALRYPNFDQSIDLHAIQVSYGRRVTGRLAFQVAVGPEIAVSRIPLSGGGSATPSANYTQFLLALNVNAQYQLRRVALGLNYDHGVSSGSGLLAGATVDTVGGSATRRMSPTFSSALTAGYSRDSGAAIGVPTNQSYNYWYVGTNLTHPWGNVGVTFSYQLEYQDSSGSFCTGTGVTCGTNLVVHVISLGVAWHGGRVIFR